MSAAIALTADELALVRVIVATHLPRPARAAAFGSRVTGGVTGIVKPWSDLDLVLESDAPIPLAAMAALREAFDESPLAFRVDLVDRPCSTTRSARSWTRRASSSMKA